MDAEGGPLVDKVKGDCDSVWEGCLDNWSIAASCDLKVSEGHSTVHCEIVTCIIWVVSRVYSLHTPLQTMPSQMVGTKSESDVVGSSRCRVMVTMMLPVGCSPLWNRGTLISRA